MAPNFSRLTVDPAMDVFSRRVYFVPWVSRPGPYIVGRGIFRTGPVDLIGMDQSVISDQETMLDVRRAELPSLRQGDQLYIPADEETPAEGSFEITDVDDDGGGLDMYTLRRLVSADLVLAPGLVTAPPVLGTPVLRVA
jgi:hypothetical protein